MKKFREFLSKPVVTAVLFALAVFLLAGGAIGGTRAALNIQSDYYKSEVRLSDIGVALVEQKLDGSFEEVSGKDALMHDNTPIEDALKTDKKFLPGKEYPEVLAVKNTGDVSEFVRVAVYKYWCDEQGNKTDQSSGLNPEWIKLGFVTGNGWEFDTDSTSKTDEREILYYDTKIAHNEVTSPFLESISIDNIILTKVTQETYSLGDVTVIETTFMYNGKQFCIEVHVDGVQDHNAELAKMSAWGVK